MNEFEPHVCLEVTCTTVIYMLQEAHEFAQFFKEPICDRRIELVVPTPFSHSSLIALSDIRSKDVNIIMGFFGPENAREVLCMVSIMYMYM